MADITNELLKQAVADAEAVRDTAIANAKLALEESITPAIKSMLAKRLRAEAEKISSANDSPTNSADGKETELGDEHEGDAKEMKDETLDTSTIGTGDNKQPTGFDSSEVGDEGEEAPADAPTSDDDYYDDWDESDFDLEEVLKELEGEVSEVSHDDEDKEDEDEEEVREVVDEGSMEAGYAHPEGKKKNTVNVPPTKEKEEKEDGDEEKKLDLEAIIRELVAEAGEDDEEEDETREKMATELATLKAELAEYREAVTILRDKLQEVHLLNAKLLYTNKLFQKGKLTNEQAVRVLDSFDRAKTLREVKMVYALMVENIKAIRTESRVPSRSKTVVTEGLASRPTPSTAPKKEQLNEGNTAFKRLQYLAGINS
jgi:hypothetical protein